MLYEDLNFATSVKLLSIRQATYWDLIGLIGDAALKIPKTRIDELRWKVRQALEKSKPPKPNISNTERLAIKSLQDHDNIIILLADKGNATLVMADLIGNGDSCKVKKDPTLKTERKLSQISSKNKDVILQIKYRQPTQLYSKLPHICGLQIYIRPIDSNRGSPCHQLWRSSAQ